MISFDIHYSPVIVSHLLLMEKTMRKQDINNLSLPYADSNQIEFDRRFDSAIGADVPSAGVLVKEIFSDFDANSFGIWWWNSLPTKERILISDYLYQCASDIETNLVEAKLHYLEWLDARERSNEKIADAILRDSSGNIKIKMPPSKSPLDDLSQKLEKMHICGFFRAIGSSLDCLGASIIGVLALPVSLRRSDIGKAEKALSKVSKPANQGSQLQQDFRDFFENVKKSSGTEDWLEWADQYRNMFVHRGRRITSYQISPRKNPLYDSIGRWIPRAESNIHLAKYPDRSDIEAFIKGKDINLDEDAEITLVGIFNSCRNLNETICERLVSIWKKRRSNPQSLEQPQNQWDDKIRNCKFVGYDSNAESPNADLGLVNPILSHRMLSASVDDAHRNLWNNSKWNQ